MKSMLRTLAVPACVVAIGAAAIIWNLERTRKIADEARLTRQRAEKGDANAEYELGRMYVFGRGVPQDYAEAKSWFQKAADQGQVKAIYSIGNLYYYGDGVTQSYSDALVWYRKAADQGYKLGEYAVGTMYYYGYGVPQSYSDAMTWLRKAADQGDMQSEYYIAYMYGHGFGVTKDHNEAERWCRKAASHGDKDAQRALGLRLPPCNRWVGYANVLGLVGTSLLLFGSLQKRVTARDLKLRKADIAGLIVLLCAAMNWFEYSRFGLFPSAWAAIAFKAATSFLGGVGVTELIIIVWPKALKALLIFNGLLFLVASVCLFAIFRMGHPTLPAIGWRFAMAGYPLGMAIVEAVHIFRGRNQTENGDSESPEDTGGLPHAV